MNMFKRLKPGKNTPLSYFQIQSAKMSFAFASHNTIQKDSWKLWWLMKLYDAHYAQRGSV